MKKLVMILLVAAAFAGCKDDDPVDPNELLRLNINGLEDLGSDAIYEGWLIVNGSPITTGTFSVDGSGNLSETSFDIDDADLEAATKFVLTIEPVPDNDPAPSDIHILAGDFNTDSATLTVDDPAALGTDFTNATGGFILATPTDGAGNNENSGVWWLDNSSGSPVAALSLPDLPASGWKYEGWAVIDGIPVSTGTFLTGTLADDAAPFSGPMPGPPFPGEDFLENAPTGLTFPTDLSGTTMVISVEPSPDNSPAPFTLKPIVGNVPANATDHLFYPAGNNATNTNPTGTATR